MTAVRSYPRDLPPMWLLVALLTMMGLHFLWPVGIWLQPPWTRSGWVIVVVAVALAATAALRFRRVGTGVRPFRPATMLVAEGAFRWTRNPMYCGLLGVTVGVAVALGSISPLAVVPAFWWLLDRRFVRAEEQFLRQRFGAAYDAYCQRVRRWL